MSRMKIPDELLEMVSGGTLTHEGVPLTRLMFTRDGVQGTRADGKVFDISYSKEAQGELKWNPKIIHEWVAECRELHDDIECEYRLEDLDIV